MPEIDSSEMIEKKREQNILIHNEKHQRAKQKKKKIDLKLRHQKILFLKRWDLFRQKKEEQERINTMVNFMLIFVDDEKKDFQEMLGEVLCYQ